MEHLIVAIIVLFWFVLGWCVHIWVSKRFDIQWGHYEDDPAYKYLYIAVRVLGRWRHFGCTFLNGKAVK